MKSSFRFYSDFYSDGNKMTHDPELLCDMKKVISDRDSEISSQRQCIIYQQHVIERLLRLLRSAHESVCSL